MDQKQLDRKLRRLDFLAELFEQHGFSQICMEIKALRTETEINSFYNVLRGWLL